MWKFSISQRCSDPWYNEVLQQCREGRLSQENYNFLHGYPTGRPTLEGDRARGCSCLEHAAAMQENYVSAWAEAFCSGHCSAESMKQLECAACQKERLRRCRVLANKEVPASVHDQPPVAQALMLHAFNVPRYYALLLRAKTFATSQGHRHWQKMSRCLKQARLGTKRLFSKSVYSGCNTTTRGPCACQVSSRLRQGCLRASLTQ